MSSLTIDLDNFQEDSMAALAGIVAENFEYMPEHSKVTLVRLVTGAYESFDYAIQREIEDTVEMNSESSTGRSQLTHYKQVFDVEFRGVERPILLDEETEKCHLSIEGEWEELREVLVMTQWVIETTQWFPRIYKREFINVSTMDEAKSLAFGYANMALEAFKALPITLLVEETEDLPF